MIRILSAVVLLALTITVAPPSAPQSAPQSQSQSEPVASYVAAATPTSGHPYSRPIWYPLRDSDMDEWVRRDKPSGRWSSTIGCTWGNPGCKAGQKASHDGEDYHPYFALDFNADKGDPVYAMGAGIFHVGDATATCVDTNEVGNRGIWGWIDHGGGTTSRYHHLDTIAARLDGKLVTPSTKIGTVGISGSKCTAKINYLHVGVTRNGPSGVHTNPGVLRACQNGRQLRYPRHIRAEADDWAGPAGYTSWKEPVYRQDAFPWGDDTCVPNTPATPDRVARPTFRRGNTWARIYWNDPSRAAGAVVIQMQVWAPSINDWAARTWYRHVSGSARAYTWRNLVNGRTYRFRVAYRNKAGYAGWSYFTRNVVPAAPPDTPRHNANYPQAGRTNIRYAWRKSRENGTPVTGYLVVLRMRRTDGTWTRWRGYNVGPGTYYKRWDGLYRNRVYAMRVLARSAVGPSRWKRASSIRTLR